MFKTPLLPLQSKIPVLSLDGDAVATGGPAAAGTATPCGSTSAAPTLCPAASVMVKIHGFYLENIGKYPFFLGN